MAKGWNQSKKAKNAISSFRSKAIWINNGDKEKAIMEEELLRLTYIGWSTGRLERVWINKEGKSKRIERKDLDIFLAEGWVSGRT